MLAFALFGVSIGCVIGGSIVVARRVFARCPADAIAFALLLCLLCLYVIPVVTGLFGVISVPAYVLGSALALTVSALCALAGPHVSNTVCHAARPRVLCVSWKYGAIVFLLVLVLFFVYRPIIAHLHTIHVLFWDVVSFALPNAVRYLQVGSLWSVESAFGISYPYGYELSVAWPILFFKSESLIGVFHGLFVLASLFYFAALLCLFVGSRWRGAIVLGGLILLGLIPPVRQIFWYIGKNDVAVVTFGLSALYFFVRCLISWAWPRIVAVGISLGLMIGTKAIGLAYLAMFLGLILLVALLRKDSRHRATHMVGAQIVTALIALLVGCPWYIRNWLLLGDPFGLEMGAIGMQRSIVWNLLSPQFWRIDLGLWTLAVCCIVSVVFALAGRVPRLNTRLAALQFAFLGSVLVFAVTPFGAFGSVPEEPIQLRLSGIMIPLLVLVTLLPPARLLDKVENNPSPGIVAKVPGQDRVLTLLVAAGICALLAWMYYQLHAYQPPAGLPGYEPQIAYRAIKSNLQGARLYSINLRPYGLLGSDYSNYVLYSLHGNDLTLSDIMGTLTKYNADYLLVGRDPNIGAKHEFPEAVAQMQSAGLLPTVYADPQFAVFKVPSGKAQGLDCGLRFVSGWYEREETDHSWWYWSGGSAHLDVYAATEGTVTLSAEFRCAPELTSVQIRFNGRNFAEISVHELGQLGPLSLAVQPGRNRIELASTGSPAYLGDDPRSLAFALKDTEAYFEGNRCVVYSN